MPSHHAESLIRLTARHWIDAHPAPPSPGSTQRTLKAPVPWLRPVATPRRAPRVRSAIVERIETLFERHGHDDAYRSRSSPLTPLEHALQCAQLAEWMQADDALVAAALLHDIGHLLAADGCAGQPHERRAAEFLATGFCADVVEPIALHVQAKRYLVGLDATYRQALSGRSLRSLDRHGGPMPPAEREAFAALPYAGQAVALRRCDDMARCAGKPTPPLAHYLAIVEDVLDAGCLRVCRRSTPALVLA